MPHIETIKFDFKTLLEPGNSGTDAYFPFGINFQDSEKSKKSRESLIFGSYPETKLES